MISFKIKNFNFIFFKQKSFNKYLLNDFCLKKIKLKFLILKEIIFCLNNKLYGKTLVIFFNADPNFIKSRNQENINYFLSTFIKKNLFLQTNFYNITSEYNHKTFFSLKNKILFYKIQAIDF